MKKVLTLVFVFSLALLVGAYAESSKYSDMTDEELLKAIDEMKVEAVSRGLYEGETIGKGIFQVGIDMKAGNYRLTCVEEGTKKRPSTVHIYSDMKACEDMDAIVYLSTELGETISLNVQDGQVVYVVGGLYTIDPEELSFKP